MRPDDGNGRAEVASRLQASTLKRQARSLRNNTSKHHKNWLNNLYSATKVIQNAAIAKSPNALVWVTILYTRMIAFQVSSLRLLAARHHPNPVQYYLLFHPMHTRPTKALVVHTSLN